MDKAFDIVALGELLIDFTQQGVSPTGMRLFEQNPGGAPANLLSAAAKLGSATAFIGKVGADAHGAFLQQTLQEAGIDTAGLILDADVFTTLAFVEVDEKGERHFSFARKPGADTCLRAEELAVYPLTHSRVLHVGSLSLTHEPARSATLYAIKLAKQAGALISYDPNYRAPLWLDVQTAREQMRSLVPLVDVMKVSDEETELLTGVADPHKAAEILLEQGVQCVAVTLGSKGVLVATAEGMELVPASPTKVVDTTGAGDAFWGGFLHRLLSLHMPLSQLTLAEAVDCGRWGNAVASLCITRRGGIPAMPKRESVESVLLRNT